jgi:competence protein ComFC
MNATAPARAGGRELLSRAADAVLSVLLPARCVGCAEFETFLCASCARTLEAVGIDVCPRCGTPRPQMGRGAGVPLVRAATMGTSGQASPARSEGAFGGLSWPATACAVCVGAGFSFASARSAFLYRGAARDLVSSFKHHGQRCLAPTMAGLAAEAFGRAVDDLGQVVVTWVPSHGTVERTRGYNQAEVLARAFATARGGLPVVRLARKTRRTAHQQGLGRASRQHNLAGAFRAVEWQRGAQDIEGVVLVDDVYTTGATTSEVAAVLQRVVELPVHVFTFARAVSPTGGAFA